MTIKAIVEIPMSSTFKYELKEGELHLDRVLNQPVPFNYGYIPNTLADDSDPLDIWIVSDSPIVPGTIVKVTLLGAIKGKDQGKQDDKLIASIEGDTKVPEKFCNAILQRYLATYKPGYVIEGVVGKEEAQKLYLESAV